MTDKDAFKTLETCRIIPVIALDLPQDTLPVAGALGGLKALNALAAPFLHTGVRFVPTGGVNADNLADYLGAQSVLAVGGTWLATSEDIRKGAWAAVAGKCRQAVEIRDAR